MTSVDSNKKKISVKKLASIKKRSWFESLQRMVHFRLLVPILRGRNEPILVARGSAVGLAIAFTPTVGVQMLMVAIFWAIQKTLFPNWNFNLVVALAWTWVTNVFTSPFIFYIFLITGKIMLGREKTVSGFEQFNSQLQGVTYQELGWIDSLWYKTVDLFILWGEPIFVGSIPYIILVGWLGYYGSLKYLAHRKLKVTKKQSL